MFYIKTWQIQHGTCVNIKNSFTLLKRIGLDSVVYGLGTALGKAVPFLLLPFYTKYLEPSDYGVIEIMSILSAFLTSLINLGLDSAQSFFFFKFNSGRKFSTTVCKYNSIL